jgi:hypothetical protein
MEYGIWNMEYGIWNMEYGIFRKKMRKRRRFSRKELKDIFSVYYEKVRSTSSSFAQKELIKCSFFMVSI